MTGYLTRDRVAIVAALSFPLAAAAILVPWRASWADTDVALLLVVVVAAVAAIGNGLAGALAAIWAAIWFDFFFTAPYERLTIRTSSDATTFAVLFIVGIMVSQLAARARRLKVLAITDAGYLARIQETASLAQRATAPHMLIEQVRKQLIGLLDLRDCRFEYGVPIDHPPRLEQDGIIRAEYGLWAAARHAMQGEETELRALSNGQYYGRFMMTPNPDARPPLKARLAAVTLAGLAGQALGARPPSQKHTVEPTEDAGTDPAITEDPHRAAGRQPPSSPYASTIPDPPGQSHPCSR
jgi:hypothetical protein